MQAFFIFARPTRRLAREPLPWPGLQLELDLAEYFGQLFAIIYPIHTINLEFADFMQASQASPLYQSPGLPRVFAAMVYDSLLLTAISLAYGALVVGLRVLLGGAPEAGQRIHWNLAASIVISLGWFALLIFFYAYFWHRFGQTLGMKTWRLQMLDASTYQLPTYPQCIIRSLAAIVSLALFGLGYWCKLFHPQQKMLHDILSGTRLILLKK